MNQQELVEYQSQVNRYIQDVKLIDFFENLTRLLVLSKPKDPLSFLIQVIEHRVVQRLILVHGIVTPKRAEIVQAIGNSFNYKVLSIEELMADQIKSSKLRDVRWLSDSDINDAVFDSLKRIEKHHRGVILSGYPQNLQQSLYLQQRGLIPERFFVLNSEKEFCMQYYQILYENSLKDQGIQYTQESLDRYVMSAIERDQLNRNELDLIYGVFMDQFDVSQRPKEDIIDNLKQIIKIRDRKFPPLRFPRVMIIRPPKLKERAQQLTEIFSKRYGLKKIVCFQCLEEQIIQQTEIGKYIQRALTENVPIPDDIVQSIIYTKVQSTEARSKGWILEGFPKNKTQFKSIKTSNFEPNLILILNDDEEIIINKIRNMKFDPLTGKKHESVPLGDKQLISRLAPYKIESEVKMKQDLMNYTKFTREMEEQYGDRVQIFKIDKDSIENIIRITDVFLNNPKIYN